METKHTKGKWKATENNYNKVASILIQAGALIVADVHNLKEAESNAKLIAAAPDLLEALIRIRNEFNSIDNLSSYQIKIISNATSLINKVAK